MKSWILPFLLLPVITSSWCKAQGPILCGVGSAGAGLGNIFHINTANSAYTSDYSFYVGPEAIPTGDVIQATDGLLYGMTSQGGANGYGSIFRYYISSDSETDIHDFSSAADGQYPHGSLIQASNGLLYGMTYGGGSYDSGTIFSYDISTGIETVIHNFGLGGDGTSPYGSLIQASNGLLYGMTWGGGLNHKGIIFSYDISTGTETDIYDFGNGTDGQNPYGSLIQASDSLLYGMTNKGGINGAGTIFNYAISSGKEKDLHDFGSSPDGKFPQGSFIQANDTSLYGMTNSGGINNIGIIFSYNITTNHETVIHDFSIIGDGRYPCGSLMQASNGLLYGLGQSSYNGNGSIFSYNIGAGIEKDLYDFGSSQDGYSPLGSLIQASNGLLYGTTEKGGTSNGGTLFSFSISADSEKDIFNFGNSISGQLPNGPLLKANNNLLYVLAFQGGLYDGGLIFSYNISNDSEANLHYFGKGSDGANPNGTLIQADNGLLYGLTTYGGTFDAGTIFQLQYFYRHRNGYI